MRDHEIAAWSAWPPRPWCVTRRPPPTGDEARLNFERSYQAHRAATLADHEFARYAGESYHGPLLDHLASINHFVGEDELEDMMLMDEWADMLLLREKAHWDVPRPYELATSYGIIHDLPHPKLYAFGRSYPSGHTLLARLWARALATLFPNECAVLLSLSKRIAISRVHAFVHTFADIDYGLALADEAWTHRFK